MLYITNNSINHQSFIYSQLNDQTVLILPIQFSISPLFALSLMVKVFLAIDRTLSGATTLGESEFGSDGN